MIATVKATGKKISIRKLKDGCYEDFNSPNKYTKEELIFPSTDKKAFIKDLKELLEKYNACIGWTCDDGSDLYGIYNDRINVVLNDTVEIDFKNSYIDSNSI